MLVGCGIFAAVYMKKGLESDAKASFLTGFQALFQFAKANPDGAAVRTAALVRVAFGWRRFCCGKNERVSRCGAGGGNASCGWLHLITASGGADTIRHCHEVNKSSLHSVPHWNYIHLYLPKGSGGFRSPSRGSLLGTRTRKSLPLEGKVSRHRRDG